MKREEAINLLQGAKSRIRAKGALHLFLFGSVARDEAVESSDVDVFIDRDPSIPFGLMELSGLGIILEEVLGTDVDVGTRGALHPLIRAEVEQQAIQVF
jgi:predicted nucleotidyltransferase